jgi:hypothetical protein
MAAKGVVEHSAKGDAVDFARLQAKPKDPAGVLIPDYQYPVSPQQGGLAAKEVHAPETVPQVTEESQPRRTAGVRFGEVRRGQDAPNDVLIDGDAERPSDLRSDSRAAPGRIALFGGDDGINEFLRRTLGTGLRRPFGEKSRRYLRLVRI